MRIQIGEYEFEIAAPYAAGQVISAADATALNSARAERVRNAIYRRYVKIGGASKVLSGEQVLELRDFAAGVDKEFSFEAATPPAPKRGKELEEIIRELALERSHKTGESLEELCSDPGVINQANSRLEVRRRAAAEELEALLR